MYMNCAVVRISGGLGESHNGPSLSSRPDMFVANVGNGCTTVDSTDVMIPNPGSDVDVANPDAAFPSGSGCDVGPGAVASSPKNPGSEAGPLPDSGDGSQNLGWDEPSEEVEEYHGSQQPRENGGDQGIKEEGTDSDVVAESGHDPGNDWPVWFNSGGKPNLGGHGLCLLRLATTLGAFFHRAWFL